MITIFKLNTMSIKQEATKARNAMQQGIYAVINPFVRLLIKMGVTPNMVTTIGLLGQIAAAAVMVWAGYKAGEGVVDFTLLTISGIMIIVFSVFDMLDGQVARLGNMASTFGAMYDSVLDRYCELFILGGISYYLIQIDNLLGALLTFLALVGSLMVSYVRASGEGLGVVCKIGFMQRPERVVVTTIAVLGTGIAGSVLSPQSGFDANVILVVAMAFMAVLANFTAFARIAWCKKEIEKAKI